VDDGRLALVQAGHSLAGVTEDVEHLGLAEAHVQPLVHLLHHLALCRGEERERNSFSGDEDQTSSLLRCAAGTKNTSN